MLPWVVLGAMLVVGLLLSVIYTGVVFIIDGLLITSLVWFIIGLIVCGNYLFFFLFSSEFKRYHSIQKNRIVFFSLPQLFTRTCGVWCIVILRFCVRKVNEANTTVNHIDDKFQIVHASHHK